MGSQSDWATMRHAAETLEALGVACDARIVSAHRTPDRLVAFAKGARGGRVQGHHRRRGRRRPSARHDRRDDALARARRAGRVQGAVRHGFASSIVQMPGGVPVGTLAIGKAGRDQRGAARRRHPRARRRRARATARRMARAPDRGGRRTPVTRRPHAPRTAAQMLAPGATIGILGGGQLGRMLALAGARLGLRAISTPTADDPAFEVGAARTIADYGDEAALAAFAAEVDVVTYEFENVPVATAAFLNAASRCGPSPRAGADPGSAHREEFHPRPRHRGRAVRAGRRSGALARAVGALGRPSILKTRRFGYDGKGQSLIREGSDIAVAFRSLGGQHAILEGFVPFVAKSRWSRRAGSTAISSPGTSAATSTSNIFSPPPSCPPISALT